ncbi:FF domain-containing protein [Phthorimaea operculella]|nr:FF domain-containing protein [Phthorimaea operculella]
MEEEKEDEGADEAANAEGSEDETSEEAARQREEREARAQASIKEREREVQRALATSLRDRDKEREYHKRDEAVQEREYHKRDEAVQHFNALLADLVRNPELAWRDAKKQLKKDHRYTLADLLTKDDKERLFSQHIANLTNKRRDKLRALLTEMGVGCTEHWRDVKQRLKQEPTAPVYSTTSQMEREFRDYQRDKLCAAKTALRQLLQETRAISHRSLAATSEHPAAMTALHDSLKHDARYLALEHIPDERQAIIQSYLEELAKKGPPPPPTATEPTRRAK